MKRVKLLLSYALLSIAINPIFSQVQPATDSPILNYGDRELTNTATVPDFEQKENKLKLSGIVYEADGVTPAKDVILYFQQADESGDFDLRKEADSRYIHHQAWIKTDSDGRYTYFTFIPGNDRRYNQFKELFPLALDRNNKEYEIPTFLFDDDPLLSKSCRKRMAKKGDLTRILKPVKKEGILVAERNITLSLTK